MSQIDFNVGRSNIPGTTQNILLEEQDRAKLSDPLLTRIKKKHEALITTNYLLLFINVGIGIYSIFVTLGLGIQAIFPFLIVGLLLTFVALWYAYKYLSKLLAYCGLSCLVAAFVIAFSLLP